MVRRLLDSHGFKSGLSHSVMSENSLCHPRSKWVHVLDRGKIRQGRKSD